MRVWTPFVSAIIAKGQAVKFIEAREKLIEVMKRSEMTGIQEEMGLEDEEAMVKEVFRMIETILRRMRMRRRRGSRRIPISLHTACDRL